MTSRSTRNREPLPTELELARRQPSSFGRLTGIAPHDPYLERCWRPVLQATGGTDGGAASVELLREVYELTGPPGSPPLTIACDVLAWRLGIGVKVPRHTRRRVALAMRYAYRHGLARVDLSAGKFELYDPMPLLPAGLATQLAPEALDYHLQRLDEVAERLRDEPLNVAGARPRREAAREVASSRRLLTRIDGAAGPTATPPEVSR